MSGIIDGLIWKRPRTHEEWFALFMEITKSIDSRWILDRGPFSWKKLFNPYAHDLKYVVMSRRGEKLEWWYSKKQAEQYCAALNERLALIHMVKGTPAEDQI